MYRLHLFIDTLLVLLSFYHAHACPNGLIRFPKLPNHIVRYEPLCENISTGRLFTQLFDENGYGYCSPAKNVFADDAGQCLLLYDQADSKLGNIYTGDLSGSQYAAWGPPSGASWSNHSGRWCISNELFIEGELNRIGWPVFDWAFRATGKGPNPLESRCPPSTTSSHETPSLTSNRAVTGSFPPTMSGILPPSKPPLIPLHVIGYTSTFGSCKFTEKSLDMSNGLLTSDRVPMELSHGSMVYC